jgi:hypothetical protein
VVISTIRHHAFDTARRGCPDRSAATGATNHRRLLGGYWFTMRDLMHGRTRNSRDKSVVKQFSK